MSDNAPEPSITDDDSLDPCFTLRAQRDEARAQAAMLREALERCVTQMSRAGLLLSRSNQADTAPASSISAELAIREADATATAALAGTADDWLATERDEIRLREAAIAGAVLEEREACAMVARAAPNLPTGHSWNSGIAEWIANRIRARSEQPDAGERT